MRKETINTFSDGMSLDLNPLGTPAKTLTNCLNGTLITYNGNELTLQNDMGNAEVGTAALPKGYVPVGMKEYGGIIYVASYNPETKKGQLGCFPSPQQIYTSEAAQTIMNINLQETFIQMVGNIPFIKFNEYKEEIFKDSITQEPKIFNSGDLFIIKTENNFSEQLREAIDKNIITFKLYIIPTQGGSAIDITDCSNLKLNIYKDNTYHNDLWIFQNEGNIYNDISEKLDFDTLISEYPQYLQSYPRNIGPGILQLVIEFNTFKAFNLYNKIEEISNGFRVQFVGEAESDDTDVCNPVAQKSLLPLQLIGSINYFKHYPKSQYEKVSNKNYNYDKLYAESDKFTLKNNEKLFYDILPASKWGVSDDTFLKSGEISYQELINLQNKVSNWSFEVNNTNILIKWSFIHFAQDIDHMRLVFIPLDQTTDNDNNLLSKVQLEQKYINGINTQNSQYVYKIVKPYFSGDFEDTFLIDSEHLQKNYIYVCRFDVIYKNGTVTNGIDYKILYTGTFFNDKDISQFNYNNRPEVNINLDVNLQQSQTLLNKQYTVLKEELENITSTNKEEILPEDVMFLANNDLIGKLVGVISNLEYEVKNTLSISQDFNTTYNNKKYDFRISFAGNLEESNTLNRFSDQNKITFNVNSDTNYYYSQDGDELIEQCKQQYIEQEEINGVDVNSSPSIEFVRNSEGKYINTSTAKIHRGILSKLGQPQDTNVVHQGLYPVYEEYDQGYNNELLGFKLDDNDFVYNCVLFKKGACNNYTQEIGLGGEHPKKYPYSEDATVQGNTKLISQSTEFDEDTLQQTLNHMGNKPINICVTNSEQKLYGDYQDVYTPDCFQFQLTMPHEISFNETSETGLSRSLNDISEHAERFKENNLGYNSWRNQQAFFRPQTTYNCMTITWRTQYGPRLINIATPLDIENESTKANVITIERKPNTHDKFQIYTDNIEHSFANMHLRAEKLLLCMLSQILIAKCKNDVLSLNVPDQLYNTESFNNEFGLTLNKVRNISPILNGKDSESILEKLLNGKILEQEDIFVPQFKAKLVNAKIIVKDTVSISDLKDLFTGSEYPYFSSITQEQLTNIYPGKITNVRNKYICELEKNIDGTYMINDSILVNDKFYKIFLPTLITDSNDPSKKFSCLNTDTYKFMLEGYAYNDILLPTTKILQIQGTEITRLRSQDSDNPQFNLLYYNAFTSQNNGIGAVTLFGDQSAVINTDNFNPTDNFPQPQLDLNTWKSIDILTQPESNNIESEDDV